MRGRVETSRTGGETWPDPAELNNKLWAGRKVNNKMEGNNTPSEVCFASLIRKAAIEKHLKGLSTLAAKRQGFTASLSLTLIVHLYISRLS